MIYTKESGFKTSVSIEPFLDYIPQNLVTDLQPYITESIWIGPMNHIPRNNILPENIKKYDEIRKNYEASHLQEIYDELKNNELIRFKDSFLYKI